MSTQPPVHQASVSRRGFLTGLSGAAAAVAAGLPAVTPAGAAQDEPFNLDLDQIQGNVLAGFGTEHQALVLCALTDPARARGWLAELIPEVATTRQVADAAARKEAAQASGAAVPRSSWLNLAFTWRGLGALGRPLAELQAFPDDFREGMRQRADVVGDRGDSDPSAWPAPYQRTVHAVVILAADDPAQVRTLVDRERARASRFAVEVVHVQFGDARSDEPGHEHFGFRDGISQPGVRGFTEPRNPADPDQGVPGQDLLWPGEFVLGYPRQGGVGAGTEAGPVAVSGPTWTVNGSYLVFRRLRQDVAGFRAFVADMARTQGISEDLAGAKLIGRYRSGAPLAVTGPVATDPGRSDPSLLAPERINDFEFADDDLDGRVVPLAAHIRKTYPRDHPTADGGEEDTQLHRILRRGIPYGTSLPAGATPGSGSAAAAFPDDRGLLFLCYQTSIRRQFEFIQRRWANDPNFPQRDAGHDPVIFQRDRRGSFTLPGGRPDHVALLQRFVVTTGGDYFFQPSVAGLTTLAAAPVGVPSPTPAGPRARPRPGRAQRDGFSAPEGATPRPGRRPGTGR